jgi:hypothetical protein
MAYRLGLIFTASQEKQEGYDKQAVFHNSLGRIPNNLLLGGMPSSVSNSGIFIKQNHLVSEVAL